jgi:hypothetical protein
MPRTAHRLSTALAVRRPVVTMTAPRPIVVRTTKVVKAKHHKRRGRGGSALTEKHRVGAIIGGGLLGLIDKSGIDVPTLPFLGKAGTLGVAAWAIGRYMHSPWAEDAATGFLAIAAYELASQGSIAGVEGGYVAGGGL